MRLTRLDPLTTEGPEADPRIATTVEKLEEMGIEVQLGERAGEELVVLAPIEDLDSQTLVPSRRINLDLSVLIALISDLTHAPLPISIEEANKRFIPPKEYREWNQTRKRQAKKKDSGSESGGGAEDAEEELSIEDLPHDLATHSRALTNQLLGEMGRSMIQEIRDRISQSAVGGATEFWVTTEARDRCLRIVSKIGAVNEKRRAFALFCLDPSDPTQTIPLAEAEALFWLGSRFNRAIPLFPLHFHSASLLVAPAFLEDPSSAHRPPLSTNAPYLISVWNELLCAPGAVMSVFKTFLFEPKGDVRMPPSAQRKKTGVRPPGAMVDIVGDGGRVWIRINTMKNSRLLAEFREIDSYLTESEEDSDWDGDERPTLL
ncbi:hypothetical protein D9611_012428 [Ephemerocybe angulata]|uniref:Uncharacterized protein n=1 Tax=Ephemerocybe angulata TaxID=980116 RepID=A0A8H5CDY2_9AGAR|nr:hypothetical protein D9611_012428 [Tulosesus angulatus]